MLQVLLLPAVGPVCLWPARTDDVVLWLAALCVRAAAAYCPLCRAHAAAANRQWGDGRQGRALAVGGRRCGGRRRERTKPRYCV